MRKILKLNDVSILNFVDLQKNFSPLDVYAQLPAFETFALVHCVPLVLQFAVDFDGEKIKKPAEYISKEFWYGIIKCRTFPQKCKSVKEGLNFFLEQKADEVVGIDRTYDYKEKWASINEKLGKVMSEINEELEVARIDEKIAFISKSVSLDKTPESLLKVLVLLAICELSEVDATKQSFKENRIEQVKEEGINNEISLFPYEKNAPLKASKTPYKFWYYGGNALENGGEISTVKIEAGACANSYYTVNIELYSDEDESLVQTLSLKPGESCYCNVVSGKIVKILPGISLSDDLCLIKRRNAVSDIKVLSKDSQEWVLNFENIACFSAGSKEQGFLLVQNGRIISNFYKPAEDYMTKLKLDMINKPVVEVKVTDNGYVILTQDGKVIFEKGGKAEAAVVSLDKYFGSSLKQPKSKDAYMQYALSDTQKSLALIDEKGFEKVYFNGAGKNFTIKPKEGIFTLI
ncbi:MAG: hypothetical protein E7562_05645 [Ruminococcaceae bacterium]|nr:hypothetical protein [Oscillospiraceae bacterium]